MFISKQQATERLSSKLNRFGDRRQEADAATDDVPEVVETAEAELLDQPPDGEIEEVDLAGAHEDTQVLTELPEETNLVAFDELDKLIMPRGPRANYRGKLESQAAIAQTSLIIGQHATSRVFGLSQEQTLAYERGLQSSRQITEGGNSPELTKRVKSIKAEIEERAANKLMKTLGLLTDEKLSEITKPGEIGRLGKDLASIMEKAGKVASTDEGGVHFHIYRPEISVESEYKVVQIGTKE